MPVIRYIFRPLEFYLPDFIPLEQFHNTFDEVVSPRAVKDMSTRSECVQYKPSSREVCLKILQPLVYVINFGVELDYDGIDFVKEGVIEVISKLEKW